jgi:NDP-sugar pyrophosphorylase family protein
MTFATLYVDEGNLLDFHEDRDTARASVLSVVEEHPEVAEEFGMVELDEQGRRVGEFVSGAELKAQAASTRPSRAA